MRILVTGASGFLGYELSQTLAHDQHDVVGTSRDGRGIPPGVEGRALTLDDGGPEAARLVAELRPEVVLHLAAVSAVGDCGRDPERAERVNTHASGALARATAEVGGWLLYTSTDLVFDGLAPPYREDAPRTPLGPYMATKGAGEDAVLSASPEFLVVRVALLYGLGDGKRRTSFTDTIAAQLRAGQTVNLFTDEHRTPLEVRDAAELLADLAQLRPAGRLHLAGPERVSRYEHGVAVAEALDLETQLCLPLTQADVPGLGPRPRDVSLGIDRLRGLLSREPLGVVEGCRRLSS